MTPADLRSRRLCAAAGQAIAAAEAAYRARTPCLQALDAEHDRLADQLAANARELERCQSDFQARTVLRSERTDLVRRLAALDQRRAAVCYVQVWLLDQIDHLRRCREHLPQAMPNQLDWLATQIRDIRDRVANLPEDEAVLVSC